MRSSLSRVLHSRRRVVPAVGRGRSARNYTVDQRAIPMTFSTGLEPVDYGLTRRGTDQVRWSIFGASETYAHLDNSRIFGRASQFAHRRSQPVLTRTCFAHPVTVSPPPLQFRWHSHSCLCQNAQLFVHHLPLVAKRLTIAPHHHPIPPKPPVQTPPAPATLPPCSNHSPMRTILLSAPIPTRHPGPRGPTQCPPPNTANLPPPNPLTCPPKPLKPPPKPFHRPPFSPTARPMPYWNQRK